MAKSKKKIVLLLAGGTWTTDKNNEVFSVNKPGDIEPWLNSMTELSMLAEVEPVFVAGEEEDLGPKVWEKLAAVVRKRLPETGSFVVVTKPEQLLNTTIALNFLLQNLPATIITTGSQMSGTYVREKKELLNRLIKQHKGLGLRANLVNAIQLASHPLPAPAIMFGRNLIWGLKAHHSVEQDRHVFNSVDDNYWATIDFGITFKENLSFTKKPTAFYDKINANVLVVEDIIGLPWLWTDMDLKNYQAVVVKTRSQELEKSKIEKIKNLKIPVVLYSKQALAINREGISLADCSWPTAIIKTMWAAANSQNKEDFESRIKTNVVGEFN